MTGEGDTYSLMLQVPAIAAMYSPPTTFMPMAQASMSKSPAATGVPSIRPVASAHEAVTLPQNWDE